MGVVNGIGNTVFFTIIMFVFVFMSDSAGAGNFGIGVHSGYGVIKYEEETSAAGKDFDSESTLNTVLFGVSGEYSFKKPKNFFAGITTDWAFGLEDDEKWREDGIRLATNDIKIFGQFYDVRIGYKNSLDRLYYRVYVSGGWDGIQFKRDSFVWRGAVFQGGNTENFSLWRAGGGLGVGYKAGMWALDGRAAYAYYPEAQVKNDSLSGVRFDTNGTCLDLGIGIARVINGRMSFYAGGSYTLLKLDKSDKSGFVFPESEIQIIIGVVNLTYHFK